MNKFLKSVACVATVCFSLSAFAQTEEEKQIPADLTFVNNTSGSSAVTMQIIPPAMQTFTMNPAISMNQQLTSNGGSATTELTPKNPTMEIYFIIAGLRKPDNPHFIPPDCRFYLKYDKSQSKPYSWELRHYPTDFKCQATCSGGTSTTDKYVCTIKAG